MYLLDLFNVIVVRRLGLSSGLVGISSQAPHFVPQLHARIAFGKSEMLPINECNNW
jgi:hypothetical protein